MIDLSALGTLQSDGSILLSNSNINFRESMTGDYERVRQAPDTRYQLSLLGYQPTDSSVISAVGVFGDDLRIRFHNGSVYEYYGFANHFDRIMRANSKGQYFNRNIRHTKRYSKIGSIDIPSGNASQLTDEQTFNKVETQTMMNMLSQLGGRTLRVSEIILQGVSLVKYQIDDIVFYRPLISLVN